jgi:hypothetical protein
VHRHSLLSLNAMVLRVLNHLTSMYRIHGSYKVINLMTAMVIEDKISVLTALKIVIFYCHVAECIKLFVI